MEVRQLAEAIRTGDRTALARGITLVESRAARDSRSARELLAELQPDTGGAHRIGVSGVPGVGKSTFLDAIGTRLTSSGHRVAVLAVDPTSTISGGSILGDKTRMDRLSHDDRAYVRPSPGGGTTGGVARRTRETLSLCEAAGFDVVFVETIGVGQSEVAVADMVDCFVLLMLAGAGDELQGLKRGIMELADVVVLHKADGDNRDRVELAAADVRSALGLLRATAPPPVLAASSTTGDGLAEVWAAIEAQRDALGQAGRASRRLTQAASWFDDALDELLHERFLGRPGVAERVAALRAAVQRGELAPTAAARQLIDETGA